tara:strand:- start:327 stop:2780 length:2454 start_codon:yes stop_codon:yes gene_type:complete
MSTQSSITDFNKQHNIKWFPINLSFTTNKDKRVKHLEFVDEYGCIPKQTDFKTLSNEEIIERQQYIDKYEFIAIDTSVYHHIDIDMLDNETYSKEQREYIKELIKDKPYYKSISYKHGKKEGKHVIFTTDYKFGKQREQTKFKDIEILSGQWGWVRKGRNIICPNNYMCKYNVESILCDTKPKHKPKPIFKVKKSQEAKPVIIDNDKKQIFNEIRNHAKLIDIKYLDDYTSWFKIMMALKSKGEEYKEVAKTISQKSTKYDNDKFNEIWAGTPKGITIATIFHYSKISNKHDYTELKQKSSRFNVLKYLTTADGDIADVFIYHNKDDLVYKNDDFYIYHNNTWIKQDKDLTHIQGLINKSLIIVYNKVDLELAKKIVNEEDEDVNDRYRKKKEIIGKIIKIIKTSAGMKSISKAVKCKLALMDFDHIEFDALPDVLPFKTKIYDLLTHEFRDYKNTDYITMKINYDYIEQEPEILTHFNELFNQIFPIEDIRRDYSIILSSVLFGRGGSTDAFIVANGAGGNGKGVLHELMSEMLGIYSFLAPVSVICNPIKQGANPEVAGMNNKRFIIYEEPSATKGCSIDIGSMKMITGGDRINARMNYSNNTETLLKGIHILDANDKPKLNGKMDDSISRRLIDIHFMSKFTAIEDEYENLDYHYKANDYYRTPEFKKVYKHALFQYLIRFIKDYQSKNTIPIYQGLVGKMSMMTKNRTEKYIENSDFFGSFLRDNIEKTGDKNDILKIREIFNAFKLSEEYQGLYKDDKIMYNGTKKFNKKVSTHILYKKIFKDKLNIKTTEGISTTVRNVLIGCRLIDDIDD